MNERYQKDPASSQNLFCFTGEELRECKYESIDPDKRSRIFKHLKECRPCRELYRAVSKTVEDSTLPFQSELWGELLKEKDIFPKQHPEPLYLESGQIWTTRSQILNFSGIKIGDVPMGIPVLVISPNTKEKKPQNEIRIFPISTDINYQHDGESLVLDKSNPLGYPILIEMFNERPMLAGNLAEYRGAVSRKDLNKIIKERKRISEKKPIIKNKVYLAWKKKEIELAEYLTFPVNESLWEEEAEFLDEEAAIRSELSRKASDLFDTDFPKIEPYIINEIYKTTILLQPSARTSETNAAGSIPKAHQLKVTDEYDFAIVQDRDQVFLRFISQKLKPEKLAISGKDTEMTYIGFDTYQTLLGYVKDMPAEMEIMLTIQGESFPFHLQFTKQDDSTP